MKFTVLATLLASAATKHHDETTSDFLMRVN